MKDGNLPKRVKDLRGMKFQKLRPLDYLGNDGRRSLWRCVCDCGGERVVRSTQLTSGEVKHCGSRACEKEVRGASKRGPRTHGMSQHPAYWIWRSMRDRCRLPTHQAWHNYGARGIYVCERWQSFEKFWADMGDSYQRGLTIDRIDNEGPYSPSNCRWASYHQQARNQRGNRMIQTPQGEMPLWEASRVSGIGKTTLAYRVAVGWPPERLFEKPHWSNRSQT